MLGLLVHGVCCSWHCHQDDDRLAGAMPNSQRCNYAVEHDGSLSSHGVRSRIRASGRRVLELLHGPPQLPLLRLRIVGHAMTRLAPITAGADRWPCATALVDAIRYPQSHKYLRFLGHAARRAANRLHIDILEIDP